MINLSLFNVFDALSDPTSRRLAEDLVFQCGVRADLNGSRCLADAVILFGSEYSSVFGEIYRAVGQFRNLQDKSVMREIAYAIKNAFDLPRQLSSLLGIPLPSDCAQNSIVIGYLGNIFKNSKLSLLA